MRRPLRPPHDASPLPRPAYPTSTCPPRSAPQERVLCSRLLAAMARDDEHATALLRDEGAQIRRLVALLPSPPLLESEAAGALLQVR